MESTEIAIFSTLLGLILALTDAYIERNIMKFIRKTYDKNNFSLFKKLFISIFCNQKRKLI